MADIVIIFAHPKFQYSRVNRAMLASAIKLKYVDIRDVYELYPDFYIDIEKEQKALVQAHTLVLQHPLQWYSCPALLKEWLDVVLNRGWVYGEGGTILRGKYLVNAITVSEPRESYQSAGCNRYSMDELLNPFDQIACLCGMLYLKPFIFHDAFQADDITIKRGAQQYEEFLMQLNTTGTSK